MILDLILPVIAASLGYWLGSFLTGKAWQRVAILSNQTNEYLVKELERAIKALEEERMRDGMK